MQETKEAPIEPSRNTSSGRQANIGSVADPEGSIIQADSASVYTASHRDTVDRVLHHLKKITDIETELMVVRGRKRERMGGWDS